MAVYIEDNMAVIRVPQTFHFNFGLAKDFDKNLKHETEFIMKHNESLAEYKNMRLIS